jgi:uncharacterized cupredoxin-like copper-binding protein
VNFRRQDRAEQRYRWHRIRRPYLSIIPAGVSALLMGITAGSSPADVPAWHRTRLWPQLHGYHAGRAGKVGRRSVGVRRCLLQVVVMRTLAVTMLLARAWIAAKPGVAQQTVPQSSTGTLTISLSNFAFDPEHIRLKVNTPIRLRLVNESGGGHSFSAPTFFAASSLEPGSSVPTGGKVEVGSHQTVDIILAPRVPGQYRVECPHFLHTLFGMHGTIEVTR